MQNHKYGFQAIKTPAYFGPDTKMRELIIAEYSQIKEL
jgi:hypothetical protein